VIGADKFGALAFASAIIIIVETITDWGFNYTATRDVAKNRENIEKVSAIFSEVFFSRIILMIICFVGLYIVSSLVPSLYEYRLLLLLTFLYIPGHILFPEWLFQAFEQMKYITILNVLSKAIFTVLIFFVITSKEDYLYQPVLSACGFVVSGIVAQCVVLFKFHVKIRIPSIGDMYYRLRASTDMFICLILPNFYTQFSTIILKAYCGEVATGIYSGGQRFLQIIEQLTQILSRTFFPFLARHKEKHHIYVLISGSISIIACFTMFFGANLFVKLFLTEEFSAAVDVIKIFSVAPFFLFLLNTYGANYLVIVGKEDILRNIVGIASLIGFGLTWLLTPSYSYIGAAATVTIIWGGRGAFTYYYAKRQKKQ
jgi:PST family polysaccharide transporter